MPRRALTRPASAGTSDLSGDRLLGPKNCLSAGTLASESGVVFDVPILSELDIGRYFVRQV